MRWNSFSNWHLFLFYFFFTLGKTGAAFLVVVVVDWLSYKTKRLLLSLRFYAPIRSDTCCKAWPDFNRGTKIPALNFKCPKVLCVCACVRVCARACVCVCFFYDKRPKYCQTCVLGDALPVSTCSGFNAPRAAVSRLHRSGRNIIWPITTIK